jgi:hypothetical protein
MVIFQSKNYSLFAQFFSPGLFGSCTAEMPRPALQLLDERLILKPALQASFQFFTQFV